MDMNEQAIAVLVTDILNEYRRNAGDLLKIIESVKVCEADKPGLILKVEDEYRKQHTFKLRVSEVGK